ncbi:Putative LOC100197594 [Caligus rogercresseyi]|uniref:LOC100197594 n=1 Tax=Caligus rogercresseyi TaxID=217165 RepID=A0A7T8KMJ8_CALRO|nr:Putative LOC100197594 [Caligus rogercresseyi]
MVLTSDGKIMPPFLFKSGEKIDQKAYNEVLRLIIQRETTRGPRTGLPFIQLPKCQEFCAINMANFWSKEMWPSSSPDFNPLDYAVWDTLKKETNKTSHPNVDSLKTAIIVAE